MGTIPSRKWCARRAADSAQVAFAVIDYAPKRWTDDATTDGEVTSPAPEE